MLSRTTPLVLFVVACVAFMRPGAAAAQQIDVRGEFGADSIKVGELFPYALTARYPSEINLLFPDSTHSFGPFDFESKKYFKTKTTNNISYDSVVYMLSTYEIDSLQMLRLPIYVLNPADCTQVFSDRDTLFLKTTVDAVSDTVAAERLPLKTNTAYLEVSWLLNYPVLLIIGGSLAVVCLTFWLIYGKRIRKYFLIRRLTRNHASFLVRYSGIVQQLNLGGKHAEAALVIWKQYMEGLESKPYTKFTSKEILRMEQDEKLAASLRRIDQAIYGGFGGELQPVFTDLQAHTQSHFARKLEEVTHG